MRTKTLVASSIALTLIGITFPQSAKANADHCYYLLGTASSGQSVKLDLCTIQRKPDRRIDFTYLLGAEAIDAQANCNTKTWTTFPERAINRPQSRATADLLKLVCTAPSSNPGIGIGVVFNPPSHIRKSPNGPILCTLKDLTAIALAGGVTNDGWVRTMACGGGVIHQGQLRYN